MRFQRFAVLVFAALVIPAATAAQSNPAVLGAKVGWSLSTLDTDPDGGEQDALGSLTGGGFLRFGMGRFALQPELMVVTKGAQTESDDPDVPFTGKLKLDYIEVPVLFVFPLSQGTLAPYLLGGPAFAFEIGCNIEVEGQGANLEAECEDEGDDGFGERKKFDIGAMAGGGIAFPVGPGSLLFEARYTWGLTDLADADATKVRNRSLGIMAGYAIPLGR